MSLRQILLKNTTWLGSPKHFVSGDRLKFCTLYRKCRAEFVRSSEKWNIFAKDRKRVVYARREECNDSTSITNRVAG